MTIPALRASRDLQMQALDDLEATLDVSVEQRIDHTRLVVLGDLDLASGEQLRATGEQLIGRRPQRVVVDLQRLDLLDRSGVAVLERLTEVARSAGVRIDVAVLRNPQARRAIAASGALAWLSPC